MKYEIIQGRIQDIIIFFGGGGGGRAKYYVRPHAHHEYESRSHLRRGWPWKLSGLLMLSRAIKTLFLSILIQNGEKKIVDQILWGGGGLLRPL